MGTTMTFASPLLLLVACLLQNVQGSVQCGSPIGSSRCPEGCWYKDGTHKCEQCYNCTQLGLMDGHPLQCRGLAFPSYCQHDANGKDIATAIPKVHLPDNVQGNFSQMQNKWAVFFFIEDAVEKPGMTYSRVGKVCRHEWHKNYTEWVTFQKARLVCKREDDVEYNYLENIIRVTVTTNSQKSSYYYGVFAKSRSNSKESALCVFTTRSIIQAVRGEFYDPFAERTLTGYEAEAAVQDIYMPTEMTPGSCNGASLNDWQTTFIRTHPLMFETVDAENFLYKGSGHFTRLVSDTQVALSGESYIVIFIGTDDGRLLKLVKLQNGGWNVLEEILLTPVADKISDLKIIQTDEGKTVRALSATSDEPFTVPVQRCVNMSACACPQDPYCAWNLDVNACEELHENMSGDRFNQSIEEKQDCSRSTAHPALLMTSYRIPPTTMKPSTTKEQKVIDYSPEKNNPKLSTSEDDDGIRKLAIPFVCLLALCVVITSIVMYRKYKQKMYQHVCCANAGDGLKVKTTWTSITIERKVGISHMSEWRLKNSNVQPKTVKTFLGKIKTLKFEDLTPLTPYVIVKESGSVRHVTTDGPKIEIVGDSVTKTSVAVKILKWNEDFHGVIKLTSREQSREKLIMKPSDEIKIDGLLPNIEYTIYLEIKHGSPPTTISSIQFGTFRTMEEEFHIESKDGTHVLRWNQLPRQISELIISTCCSPSELVKVDASKRFAEMKHLCQVPDLAIKVRGKLETSEYEIASLCYDAQPSGAFAKLSCLSTLKDLIADIKFRKSLAVLVVRTELIYLKYCETLGYTGEEASAFFKVPKPPEDKFMQPLHDTNEEINMCIFVKALISNYEDLFNSKSSSRERGLQECPHIFRVMQKLATFNTNCEACNAIFERVKHKWECQGLKTNLPQDC